MLLTVDPLYHVDIRRRMHLSQCQLKKRAIESEPNPLGFRLTLPAETVTVSAIPSITRAVKKMKFIL